MKRLSFLLLLLLSTSNFVKAGLDKFTILDEVHDWVIERKYDSSKKMVICRASIKSYGTWFSARIRLGKNNKLLIPKELLRKETPKPLTLEKVKSALKTCRSGLIYLPDV